MTPSSEDVQAIEAQPVRFLPASSALSAREVGNAVVPFKRPAFGLQQSVTTLGTADEPTLSNQTFDLFFGDVSFLPGSQIPIDHPHHPYSTRSNPVQCRPHPVRDPSGSAWVDSVP